MKNRRKELCLFLTITLLMTVIPWSFSFAEVQDKPVLYSVYPESESDSVWYDEKSLKHDVSDSFTSDRYFIKAVFEGPVENVNLSSLENLKNCTVRPAGGTGNLLDIDFINIILEMEETPQDEYESKYIFVRDPESDRAALYVPIKELRPQTTYEVIIPAQMVFSDVSGENIGNDTITWSFVTGTTPFVKEISTGSVPEDYDVNIPIYIYGDFFYSDTVRVYFNDTEGTLGEKNKEYLEVYFPSGSDRLKVGIYDIIIQNDTNHKRTIYGYLTVVKAGENPPEDGFTMKKIVSKGEIRSDVNLSKDTLMLTDGYINDAYLKVDLDDWMGEDVLVRDIQFTGDRRYRIGMLETKSKWADITLYELALEDNALSKEITVHLGRIEPEMVKTLKGKLKKKTIRSEFIQVTGENFKVKNIFLSIPIQKSDTKNLKVYRYDEETRSFYEEAGTINLMDQKAELLSPNKGIFVVIEGK